MENLSRREKYFLYNGMSCLIRGLLGNYVLIDLRNGLSVTGRLTFVDG